jgi:hypothetical protein
MHYSKLKIALILLALSSNSFAAEGMIVKDPAGLMQNIYANINRSFEAIKQFTVENARLVAIGVSAEQQVEAINNGFANTVARLDKGKEERQNLEQLERSQPAQDACSTLAASAGLNDAACSEVDQAEELSRDRAHRYSTATGGGIFASKTTDVQDVNAENNKAAIEVMAKCDALGGKCIDPKLWFTDSPLTVDEYKALQLQNDLAANLHIRTPHVAQLKPGSPEHDRAVLEDIRRENAREQARNSLNTLQVITHGTLINGKREPGRVEQYKKYSESRLGSETWLCQVTNSCTDNYVPPAEAQRRAAEIQAVAISLQLDQYKSDLRHEALLQNALLHTINDSKPKQ